MAEARGRECSSHVSANCTRALRARRYAPPVRVSALLQTGFSPPSHAARLVYVRRVVRAFTGLRRREVRVAPAEHPQTSTPIGRAVSATLRRAGEDSAPTVSPSPTDGRDAQMSTYHVASYEKIIFVRAKKAVWITRLTWYVLFLTSARLWLWYLSTNGRILARDFFPHIT